MTAQEKILEYLNTHKTPVAVSDLAKRFLIGRETVGRVLRKLEAEGVAQRDAKSGKNLWSKRLVAVPQPAVRGEQYIPEHVKKSSYAHIRGYDD